MAPPRRPGMVTLDSDVFMCSRKLKKVGWENDAKASISLHRAADHVKPILAKRTWTVPIVKELYPANGSLLGLNVKGGEYKTLVLSLLVLSHEIVIDDPNVSLVCHSEDPVAHVYYLDITRACTSLQI
jgi:WLM domain